MTGNAWLDWVILAVSFLNTILLVWLFVVVLFTAERRSAGVWLAAGGLLAGAVFFISHTAIVSRPLFPLTNLTDFWWHAGWGPVILAPAAWYIVMLWYTGYWDGTGSALHRRQRVWLVVIAFLTVLLVGLLFFANPLPSINNLALLDRQGVPQVGGLPLLILVYPLYIFLCFSLSLDALLRPGPTARLMGDQARRQARPWLLSTTLVLMVVSLLVGWVMIWLYTGLRARPAVSEITGSMLTELAWYDLLIAGSISVAILLIGQSIVSYEIFTGKNLPRRGLLRQWQNAVTLAVDVGVVVAAALVFRLQPVYSLLLTVLLMTVFYALLSWRYYHEREGWMSRLRPFVGSQRTYERLVAQQPGGGEEMTTFTAICRDVLDAQRAYLFPLGALTALVGAPLVYPPGQPAPDPDLLKLADALRSSGPVGVALDPRNNDGLVWAIPLWGKHGLIGLFLLGSKRGGGYYTHEEIEIARAGGEHVLDNLASAELASRLLSLQRQRLTESQLIDMQTRRVLHDEVLPGLHAALLVLDAAGKSQNPDANEEAIRGISETHRQISDLLVNIPAGAAPAIARLGLVGALKAMLEEYRLLFSEICWESTPPAEAQANALPVMVAQVLYYAAREAVRNAAKHAQPASGNAPWLRVVLSDLRGVQLCIEDNGGGVKEDVAAEGVTGSGQGLALHSAMMAVVGGALSLDSQPEQFTRVTLSLPEMPAQHVE